ncbi:SUMF1/EgtB/PvdO family nonheme iron enzyme [bacterium]|nr:SUMF1/EgtB/PvdO family nonheme iron enzyme [bacterium]
MLIRKPLPLLLSFVLAVSAGRANNVAVSNLSLQDQDLPGHTVSVQFDLGWDNSFRDAVNWDACWVFVKYRVGGGAWAHATLNTTGHTASTGATINPSPDGKGVMIYRDAAGSGGNSFTGSRLRWNYGGDGVADDAEVTVRVFAVEMIYVPSGTFAAGDGLSDASQFTLTTINTSDATTTPSGSGSLGGEAGGYPTGMTAPDNASWPNGYDAFYCMKYELTQEQLVEYLNTLTYTQQAARTVNAPNSAAGTSAFSSGSGMGIEIMTPGVASSTPAVYACDFTNDGSYNQSDDGQNVACNYQNWDDMAAYADWAGLRPMTEMEFEKACRGAGMPPVAGEFAWGSTSIASSVYTLSNSGTAGEGIASNYSTTAGNCATTQTANRPYRAGIFAANAGNTGRTTSGAAYYGIMEMSGNLIEYCVTIANAAGRAYTGNHGNGVLDAGGSADVTAWPTISSGGGGMRSHSWGSSGSYLRNRVSDRTTVTTLYGRGSTNGVRCARTAW